MKQLIPFKILISETFPRHRIKINWDASKRVLPPEFQTKIDAFWKTESVGKPHLFNGDLCRLNHWEKQGDRLILHFGLGNYKALWYSNAFCREIRAQRGEDFLARALGVSAVIVSSDQQIILLKRSAQVGEDPGRFDVWGGHIEPKEHAINGVPDPFCAITTEILEEANLTLSEDEPLTCIGLIETTTTFKPEMIFQVHVQLRAAEIFKLAKAYRSVEWSALMSIANRPESVRQFLQEYREQTSASAYGALWLHSQLNIEY